MSDVTATDFEPRPASTTSGPNYEGRWRYWYAAVADLMIQHPELKQHEIAARLNRNPNSISLVVNTDMFREYMHQRRIEHRRATDDRIRGKITAVVEEGLDDLLVALKTKKGTVPVPLLAKVVTDTLDRLGYAPQSAPSVVVDNRQIDNRNQTVQIAGVSAADLEAARDALRLAEQRKAGSSLPKLDQTDPVLVESAEEPGEEIVVSDTNEVLDL